MFVVWFRFLFCFLLGCYLGVLGLFEECPHKV